MLKWTTDYFEKIGIEDARLNAEWLLSAATGMERIMLYANFEDQASAEVKERYREMVKSRAKRCPLQYVLGYTEFYGRKFYVNESTLIPRPETELLIDTCLEFAGDAEGNSLKIADIGTGSGAIAVTLACELGESTFYATDVSREALKQAQRNAEKHSVSDRISFREGHLLDALPNEYQSGDEKLDWLVSNPPYIPPEEIAGLQEEVREWEPINALDGGAGGLSVIKGILQEAPRALKKGGRLVLEIGGASHQEYISGLIAESKHWNADTLEVRKDCFGYERIVTLVSD